MRQIVCAAVLSSALVAMAAPETVKAAWFRKDISCAIGTRLAGYGTNDVSVAKLDDLEINGLCIDDGRDKILLMSFDLLGMDKDTIRKMRSEAAEMIGVKEANVMLSCTHTHGGPHTRMQSPGHCSGRGYRFPDDPSSLDVRYLDFLDRAAVEAFREFKKNGVWKDAYVGFFSTQCDENRNRRFRRQCRDFFQIIQTAQKEMRFGQNGNCRRTRLKVFRGKLLQLKIRPDDSFGGRGFF